MNSVKQKQIPPTQSTQRFVPIGEIREDSIVLKNGGMRAILQTSSVNFNLKNEDEQNAIIASYQGFLNTLDFPIQILIRSKKLDVDKYIQNTRNISKQQPNPLLQQQTIAYADYIEKIVEYAEIMEKRFYVIIPVDPLRTQNRKGMFKDLFLFFDHLKPQDNVAQIRTRHNEFQKVKTELDQRVSTVKSALESCNIRTERLNTEELIEITYQSYNPILSREEKVEDVSKINITPN